MCQGGEPRTFVYDGISRLKTATNPEQVGGVQYEYDLAGNLTKRTDPNGTVTDHAYDALNRLTSTLYAATPDVYRCYDGDTFNGAGCTSGTQADSIGRLTEVGTVGVSLRAMSYDERGRVTNSSQQFLAETGAPTYSFTYAYNLDDTLRAQQYPDGRKVSTCYDYAGRPRWASAQIDLETDNSRCTSSNPPSGAEAFYLRGIDYDDHGAVQRQELGNGLWEFTNYNNRLQPDDMRLGTAQDSSDVWRARLSYDPGGGVCVGQAGGQNNGNIRWQQITAPTDAGGSLLLCQTYGYDAFNRIAATAEQNSWSRANSYDAFGNRTVDVGAAQTISATTNRITGVAGMAAPQYDDAGNLTFHPQIGTLVYDAEQRQTGFDSGAGKTGTYVYDGDGRRIKRVSTGMGGETALYVYDAFDRLAAEYSPTGPTTAARTEYRTTDHLGSTRVTTDQTQAVTARRDFYPFGGRIEDTYGGRQQVSAYASDPAARQRFTGKERDDESNLDYFLARYYASNLGRFTTADPVLLMGQKVVDPQQWNLYGYVRNAPLRLVDPTGMYVCDGNDKQCKEFEKQRQKALESKTSEVRSGASAYGAAGEDNGVTVRFGDAGKNKAGNATASLAIDPNDSTRFRANVEVVIKSGQSGVGLRDTIAHEGIHVRDAQAFAATATIDGQYDLSKNLTSLQTEINAYGVSAAVLAEAGQTRQFGSCGGSPCRFGPGMSSQQVRNTTMLLLVNPANGYNRFVTQYKDGIPSFRNKLHLRQFPAVTEPPIPAVR